jgi:broad specificity phosphatase PhoE/predicted Na+-dependent transporter
LQTTPGVPRRGLTGEICDFLVPKAVTIVSSERRQRAVWKNLFLVRHGESTANEINRFAGTIDAPLTALGEAQARRAGDDWQTGDIDRVYLSPLLRARQTADILLQTSGLVAATAPEIILDNRLSERHFGEFTLKNKTRLQRQFGLRDYEAALYRTHSALQGGEPIVNFSQRVLSFLRDEIYPLLRRGQRLLIVAHKYVIELLAQLILRLPGEKGRDLRLPNARIIPGSRLQHYVRGESALANRVRDVIVVHHAPVLAIAALFGLVLNVFDWALVPPQWLLVVLLGGATAISLARVSISNPSTIEDPQLLAAGRLFFRFIALPWLVTFGVIAAEPFPGLVDRDILIGIALLIAAPAAVTAVILSRTSGGLILPSVFVVVLSTAMSLANTILLLAYFEQSDLLFQAFMLVVVSLGSLVLPAALVHIARRRFPISVAKAAEDHAALAVLVLAVFVVLSFQRVSLESILPEGLIAIAAGIGLRLLAVGLARPGSLYAVDDYFSVSYPNIFLVIILAGLLGNQVVLEIATWFLVPMFALAPFDDLLLKRLHHATPNAKLMCYLRIDDRPVQVSRTQAWCRLDTAPGQAQASLVSALRTETANPDQSRQRL